MWADVLTKPLQGQKFRDMRAFLQNCPRDYDDDVELQTDQLARKSMNQQAKTVASSRECVREHAKLKTKLKTKQLSQPRATSPTCVSRVTWGPTHVREIPQRDPTKRKIPQRDPTKRIPQKGTYKVWSTEIDDRLETKK